jgi:hypothetical protein
VGIINFRQSSLYNKKSYRDKEGSYILIKQLILQENIIILRSYTPNNRESKYMSQKLSDCKKKQTNPPL